MNAKHVMLKQGVTVTKPSGGTLQYSAGLALVDPELAAQWLETGIADPWPQPLEVDTTPQGGGPHVDGEE